MNIHRITTGKAINKTAAIVTGTGVHFSPVMPENSYITYDTKPETRQPNAAEKRNRSFKSLAGRRIGRFVVIGISLDFPKRWVVRCDCGKYELRTARFLKSPLELSKAKCQYCSANDKVINRYRRYEKWTMGAQKKEDNAQT